MHAGRLPSSLLRGMARSRLSGAEAFGAYPPSQRLSSGAATLASLTAAARNGADFSSDPFSGSFGGFYLFDFLSWIQFVYKINAVLFKIMLYLFYEK